MQNSHSLLRSSSFYDLIKYVYFAFWTNTFCYLDRNTIEWGKACGWPRRAIWRARLLMEVHQSETAALFGILTRPLSGRHQIDTFIDVLNDPEVMWFQGKYVWKSTSSGLMKACAAPPIAYYRPQQHRWAAWWGSSWQPQTYTHVYTQIHIHMCIRTQIHTHMCMYIYKYIYTCVYVHRYLYTCVYTNTYTYINTWVYTNTHTHVDTYINTFTPMWPHIWSNSVTDKKWWARLSIFLKNHHALLRILNIPTLVWCVQCIHIMCGLDCHRLWDLKRQVRGVDSNLECT